MAAPRPRAVRTLPGAPADEREPGATTGLTTRILIVGTIVVGQLLALTVALEQSLLDRNVAAWVLAGFSVVSFAVVLVLTRVDLPERRSGSGRGPAPAEGLYKPRPVDAGESVDDRGR
jgi:hypothetical protein